MTRVERLNKEINRLKSIIDKHGFQEKFRFNKDILICCNNNSPAWATFLYIFVLVLLPAIIFIYGILSYKENYEFWILPLISLIATWGLYNMTLGYTQLTVNLKDNYLQIDNIDVVFKKLFVSKRFNFAEIHKVDLKIYHSRHVRWHRLYLFDIDSCKHVLTDFADVYVEVKIAKNISKIIGLAIDCQKKAT